VNTIKRIRINNFKSLENVEIEIKPLTFLFGPNSSGKSSFLKALMFLSKNLFPLNTGNTIYKISDEVDLGSFKDIVTNNDERRHVVFEFDLECEFDFPNRKVFNEDKSEFEIYKSQLTSLENKNFFNVFDKLKSENYTDIYNRNKKNILFEKSKFYLTLKIEFSGNEKHKNLLNYTIIDRKNASEYKFIRKYDYTLKEAEELTDDEMHSNIHHYNYKRVSSEQFLINGNGDISNLFNNHYGYLITKDEFYSKNEYQREFDLNKLDSISTILSNKFNENEDSVKENKIISKVWSKLSKSDKINYYYEFLKFSYITERIIPYSLEKLLNYKHFPTTRIIPKNIYSLESNNFTSSEYYGILNLLNLELSSENEDDLSVLFNTKKFDNILDLLTTINNNTKDEYLEIYYAHNYLSEEEFELLKNSLYNNINDNLLKLGFKLFYSIETENDVGKIYLIGENNFKMYMANASSGMLQIFPVIAGCAIFKKYNKSNNQNFNNTILYLTNSEISKNYEKFSINSSFSSLMIEQPELHLHPKLQSLLAEIFTDTILDIDEENSIIIETHSEHLIKKIQIMVANGKIDLDKIGVFYFDNNEGISNIKNMKIESNGFLKETWPNGFFDDSADLSWELLTANKS